MTLQLGQDQTALIFILYALGLLLLAALPAGMVFRNLRQFHKARDDRGPLPPWAVPQSMGTAIPGVSLLIPARNEQAGIIACLECLLTNSYPRLEVIVMDDHSTDATAALVAKLAAHDSRVRLLTSADLPSDWNGKQYACWQLAQAAQYELLLFVDADVILQTDAIARMVSELDHSGASLVSGFPEQVMGTLSEMLLIPMMYVVLLGYLPLEQMRSSTKPEFGAGCGQLFLARRQDYFKAGGHQSIQASRHDGLQLPRSFRRAGLKTDVFDASDIARVRMYEGIGPLTRGLLKNANEGIANSKLIVLFTVLLLGSAVLPGFSLAHGLFYGWPWLATMALVLATLLSFTPRWMIARHFQHSLLGVCLHPVAVIWFVALQWIAFLRDQFGLRRIPWRGRD